MTLVEAEKLSNNILLKGVIANILTVSELLRKYPFIEIIGNGLTYNRENTLPSVQFYSVGDTWVESTPTFTQATATLSILGGDADVDEFLQKTRSNIQNLKAEVLAAKSKALARSFEDTVIYGDTSADAKSFQGWHNLVDSTNQNVSAGSGSTNATGAIIELRELIRKVLPGGPDALVMRRSTKDRLSQYAERNESPIRYAGVSEFGKSVMMFDGIPIIVNDYITQTETISAGIFSAKTGSDGTSIFAVKFGERELAGCQNGGIEVKDLGDLETKDAVRTRVKWYVSQALFSNFALARYDGITDGVWTAS